MAGRHSSAQNGSAPCPEAVSGGEGCDFGTVVDAAGQTAMFWGDGDGVYWWCTTVVHHRAPGVPW